MAKRRTRSAGAGPRELDTVSRSLVQTQAPFEPRLGPLQRKKSLSARRPIPWDCLGNSQRSVGQLQSGRASHKIPKNPQKTHRNYQRKPIAVIKLGQKWGKIGFFAREGAICWVLRGNGQIFYFCRMDVFGTQTRKWCRTIVSRKAVTGSSQIRPGNSRIMILDNSFRGHQRISDPIGGSANYGLISCILSQAVSD